MSLVVLCLKLHGIKPNVSDLHIYERLRYSSDCTMVCFFEQVLNLQILI